ncbi:MAG: hypothetical protein IT158_29630 [Bryobacterales bacterium]|nr:hypothetical protein [Bryobacterales bacterium]
MASRLTNRRRFLGLAGAATALAQVPGERPARAAGVEVLNPRGRVPLSFIIDDSTCLVNLNRFAIPQFRAAWADGSYSQDWRKMPLEIPDDFVRRFGEWCAEQGVKGKYSIVPYPACVGRLDRELPGWTVEEVEASLRLVRTLMMPNWDIHPEMVTHTRVIDLSTGHPYPHRNLKFMENWYWTGGRSVDEIAAYLKYALTILKNVDLPCEGITTPGGFGNDALPQLAQASLEACRDVFRTEIPHYFRHAFSKGPESVAPRVEYVSGLNGPDPRCVVSIIACTGDWTGNWDATQQPRPDLFITPDLKSGRLVEVIERGEPACLLAHWTGIHHNGAELGFRAFQEVVRRLNARYDNLLWMKLCELARYWAARELTAVQREGSRVVLRAPYACPAFTLRVTSPGRPPLALEAEGKRRPLREVRGMKQLEAGTWTRDGGAVAAAFDLPKGSSALVFGG